MTSDWLGFAAVLALIFLVACLVGMSRLPPKVKLLVYAALGLRIVGAVGRYAMLFGFYGGVGDSTGYYARGLRYAQQFWSLDFSPFFDPSQWRGGTWTGTQFVYFPSGIVLSFIGPTMLGEFVVFSLFGFVGLIGFALAFRRMCPHIPVSRYLRWIWLFPSLWFWPSIVGKEALTLLGIGLCMAGFFGKPRINWLPILIGLFLVYAIRPQVAAVVILSLVIGQWLAIGGRWTFLRAMQGVVILVVGLAGIWLSLGAMGMGGFDVEGVQTYMETDPARRVGGGSSIGAVPVGLVGVPLAIVNTLTRPFPWEVRNPMMAISYLEILAFWVIVWFRRRNLRQVLLHWRSNRLVGVALAFVLVYSITLGMMVANIGIIARQRVFLFPFLFILLEAVPANRIVSRVRRAGVQPSGPDPLPSAGLRTVNGAA